jgi:hypothetical protein
MSRFWSIFRDTAYFRISWSIQDSITNVVKSSQRAAQAQKEMDSLRSNSEEIIDAVYNNDFERNREKK